MENNLLELKDFSVQFKTLQGYTVYAVNNVSLQVKPKQTLAIVGESGSGKSQLMLGVMGLLPSNGKVSGTALFNGKNLASLSVKELNKIRGTEIGMIFQDPMTSLNPYLKVSTQMVEVLTKNKQFSKKQAKQKAIEVLNLVGVPEASSRINLYPHQFSGGLRQRIMIAISLLANPKLIIADEPTTALDVTIQAQILDIFAKLKDTLDLSLIMITHDLAVVSEIADIVAVFYGGNIAEIGTREEVFNSPKHPYTKALLNSIPRMDQSKNEPLFSIEGFPQVMLEPPKECTFINRCKYANAKCKQIIPQQSFSATHKVRCINAGEI